MNEELTKQIWRIANGTDEADVKLERIRWAIESWKLSQRNDGTRCAACGQTACDPYTCPDWQ